MGSGDSVGVFLLVVGAVGFLLWYFIGAAINRRRIAAAAGWVHRGLETFRDPRAERTKASIKWLSTNAFNILIEGPRPPLSGVVATVLLQSRDMVTVWFTDKLTGRRDMLLLQVDFERQPIWGLEVFRAHSLLAGDSRRLASTEGWPIESSGAANLLTAHGGGKAGDLCQKLLEALGAEQRRLVRLAVRRQPPHLTLALDLPDPWTSDPQDTMRLVEGLATITLEFATK